MDLDLLIESEGLYQTVLETGQKFTYRILTQREYKAFRMLRDSGALHPWDVASKVFTRCYVGDTAFLPGDMRAGVEISLGNLIMHLSGDCEDSIREDIERYRTRHPPSAMGEYMKRVICLAFTSVVWDDFDHWSYQKLLDRFVVSEAILVNRGIGYEPIDLDQVTLAGQERRPRRQSVDFAAENAAITKAMGPFAQEDAAQSQKLSRDQLQALQARARG